MPFLQLNDIESVTSGTRLFGLGTFWSDYETLQKSTCSHFNANILKSTRSFL